MSDARTCPNDEQLQAAISGNLAVNKQTSLEEHLSHCSSCQQRVQRMAGSSEVLRPNKPIVPNDVQSDALRSAIQRLRRGASEDAPASEAEILRFLKPSPDSECIGRFGAYDVLQLVGRGGMGVVLKARDSSLNRIVAIKVLLPALAVDTGARQRFLREAQAAAAVIHDNVVTIHAVGEQDELPYLVMEYVEGQSLQERIESGRLETPEILRIGRQISAGLAAAHAQGLVHRDIKPANILLQNGVARVKITDFGLAKAVDDVSLTRSGTIAGTPQYLSPEQANAKHVDHRTDLFSLGGVLYAMCTGCPPFTGDSTAQVIRQVCDEKPRPIAKLNEDIPAWLVGIIVRLLDKDPRRRFVSASDVEQVLNRRLLESQSGSRLWRISPPSRTLVVVSGLSLLLLASLPLVVPALRGTGGGNTDTAQHIVLPDPGQGTAAAQERPREFHVSGTDQAFGTLAEAIEAAAADDVIEIRGNGPYDTRTIQIESKPLTIRAANRFRPTIRLQHNNKISAILVSDDALFLEGLVLEALVRPQLQVRNVLNTGVIKIRNGDLEISRCTILAANGCGVWFDGPRCRIENTLVRATGTYGVVWRLRPDAEMQINNSVLASRGGLALVHSEALDSQAPCQLVITQSTLVGDLAIRYESRILQQRVDGRTRLGDDPTLQLRSSNTIFDVQRLFVYEAHPTRRPPRSDEQAEKILSTLLSWDESRNFYRDPLETARFMIQRDRFPFFAGDSDLAGWQAHFGVEDSESIAGTVTYDKPDDLSNDLSHINSLDPTPPDGIRIGAHLWAPDSSETTTGEP